MLQRILSSVVILIVSQVLLACQSVPHADYYVSPDGRDSWSGKLAQPNKARTDGPFASVERAMKAVAEETFPEPYPRSAYEAVILIRAGTYYLDQGLLIQRQNWSTPRPLTIASYPGETAKLVGGKPVTNWRKVDEHIYEARLPVPEGANQIYVDGIRAPLARHPNHDYLPVAWVRREEPVSKEFFRYRALDFRNEDKPDAPDPATWDISQARVVVWPRIDWFSFERRVTELDLENHIVKLDEPVRYDISSGNRYFFKNIPQLLDVPGEAFIDTANDLVRLWPPSGAPQDADVIVATAPYLFRIEGRSPDQRAENVQILNLDLSITAGTAIELENVSHITIHGCRIENTGEHGIALEAASHVTITDNLIQYIGYHGITLRGGDPTAPDAPNNDVTHSNVIDNNHIHHVGRRVGHACGIAIWQAGRNQITHNLIHHSPRYGINLSGLRYQLLKEENPRVNFENRHEFLHARENLIAFNHIHHVVLDSADAGAISAWGAGRDNMIYHNLIHEVGNARSYNTHGIFLDDGVDYWRVSHNTVWGLIGRTTANEAAFIKGIGHVIENNVLIVDQNTDSGIGSDYYVKTGEVTRDLTFRRNIIYIESDRGAAMHFWNWSDDRVKHSDHNLFYSPHGRVTIYGGIADQNLGVWQKHYDQHSLILDPRFINAGKRDYRLKEDSPAFKLGFEKIDYDSIGLRDDYPKRLQQ